MEVNGKFYPMWGQFVEKKNRWIGGELIDRCNVMGECPATKITDVTLTPNGEGSALISFVGEDYTCSSDVKHIGLGTPDFNYPDHMAFHTGFGNTFLIKAGSNA